jgi:hypothetical protein
MKRETLEKLRFLVPGVLIVLGSLSVIFPKGTGVLEKAAQSLKEDSVAAIAAIGTGALYYTFSLRRRLYGEFWRTVDSNIARKIVGSYLSQTALSTEEEAYLLKGSRLKHIFYMIVDNDESLKSRALGVYFNGLIVTSLVDFAVLSAVFAIAHSVCTFANAPDRELHLWWAAALLVGCLLAKYIAVPLAIARHTEKSDDQLDLIAAHYGPRLRELCDDELRNMHKPSNETD